MINEVVQNMMLSLLLSGCFFFFFFFFLGFKICGERTTWPMWISQEVKRKPHQSSDYNLSCHI